MNFYFVKPSCTATAQATRFETNQKAPLRMLCVLVLLCFAKATLVCFAQLNYFVKPSCTATAQATRFEANQKSTLADAFVFWCYFAFAKATLVCFAHSIIW